MFQTLRRAVMLGVAGLVLASQPSEAKAVLKGGPGTSIETAYIISAGSEAEGVPVEYIVLARKFPGWKREMQALMRKNGRAYDVHTLTKNGKTIEVWFDITGFFGKF